MKRFLSAVLSLVLMFSAVPMGSLKVEASEIKPEITWWNLNYDFWFFRPFINGVSKVIGEDIAYKVDKEGRVIGTKKKLNQYEYNNHEDYIHDLLKYYYEDDYSYENYFYKCYPNRESINDFFKDKISNQPLYLNELKDKYAYVDNIAINGMLRVGIKPDDYDLGMYDYGFLDRTGREIIPTKYSLISDFSEGLAVAEFSAGKWGAIDEKGNVVIKPEYDKLGFYIDNPFHHLSNSLGYVGFIDGITLVGKNGRTGIMKNPLLTQARKNKGISAKYSKVNLSVDGVMVKGLEVYNIQNNNYFKLRDVAELLSSSNKKFSVDWNHSKKLITLKKGMEYKALGGELSRGDGKDKFATISTSKIELDGKQLNLKAYAINDNNYFKIRDLCDALNVKVEWNQETQTIVLKTK